MLVNALERVAKREGEEYKRDELRSSGGEKAAEARREKESKNRR